MGSIDLLEHQYLCARFLEITFVRMSVCLCLVCVCVCVNVYTPEAITSGMISTFYNCLNAFQFCFMALAVDVIDRCGPSNEISRQL